MKQALHIFRKDVRFLWLPIVLVLALTAVFAWSEYSSGLRNSTEAGDVFGNIEGGIYDFFLVLGWLYLVAAAIYKEQPAGDRQFWVTRPYSWKSLVGAKVLFIFTFINVPFIFSDVAILHAVGLPSPVGTLMARQAMLTGVFLLPAAARASLTKHYAQIALTGFAGLLLLLFGLDINTDWWGRLEWIPASMMGALLCISATVVLLWQYASRRTWIARGTLLAAAALCLGTFAIRPFELAVALASRYPGTVDLRAVRLVPPLHDGNDITDWSPVQTEGLPPGMTAQVDLMDFTIEAADGVLWHSGWHSAKGDLSYMTSDGHLRSDAARWIPDRFNSKLVNIRLSVAMTIYRSGTTIQMVAGGGLYKIPGIGDCSIPAVVPMLVCRAVRYPAERVVINGNNGNPVIGETRGYGALLDLSPVFKSSRQIVSPEAFRVRAYSGTADRAYSPRSYSHARAPQSSGEDAHAMKQAFHIFVKDARRCWPYIAIVLAVTGTLAYLTPKYTPWFAPGGERLNRAVDILQFLLPMAWWFTIAHVLHAEALVGDRQFWVTRPYSWRSLFLAKVLFCVAFLSVPLLVQDFIVLAAAGFAPAQMIPELLLRHCVLATIMLPAFVLASLTRNMRQFVLACLLFVIALLVPGLVMSSYYPSKPLLGILMDVQLNAQRPAAISWIEDWGPGIFFIGGALALLLWQYARRGTAPARAFVVAAYALNLASSFWSTRPIPPAVWERAVPAARYPEVAVTFAPARGRLNRLGASGAPNKVQIDIPIELTGRKRDLLRYDIAAVSIQPEHGNAWSPDNRNSYTGVASREDADWIELFLDGKDFQRLNREPVKMHALLGVTVYEEQASLQLRQGDGSWTKIPGFGNVRTDSAMIPGMALLWWRSPMHSPPGRFVCSIRDPASDILYQAEWAAMYPGASDNLHISPVVSFAASFAPKKNERMVREWQFPENAGVRIFAPATSRSGAPGSANRRVTA